METAVLTDRLAEIEKEVEKQKVQLTPDERARLEKEISLIQEKLRKGEKVKQGDMKFILKITREMREAEKRHISLKQWLELIALCRTLGLSKELIEDTFQFPGNANIETLFLHCIGLSSFIIFPANLNIEGILTIRGCHLESLPPGLKVGGRLSIEQCYQLKSLPPDLVVHGDLAMDNSVHEQVRMDAERLKKEGRISGKIIKIL